MSASARQKQAIRVDQVLDKHALKKTELRRNILRAFLSAEGPMTQGELIEALSRQQDLVDRVSVYRNLGALKGAGVLHEVDNNSYVFCSHECEAHAHLLLFCQVCHRHEEIKDHARIETVMKALAGLRFFGETQPLFFKGVCLNCVEN